MTAQFGSDQRQARRLQEWLLLLLGFAITRDERDRTAALSIATKIDVAGSRYGVGSFRFFERTSEEICEAIVSGGAHSERVLRKHLARIGDVRLRRAFEAAAGLQSEPPLQASQKAKLARADLWRGLPERRGGRMS